MKAYPEYKSSGIDWLGEIPSHWSRMPIKAVLSKSSAGTWGEEPREDGSDIICFRVADFDYQHLELGHKNLTYRSVDDRQLIGREVNNGDIVIEKSGGGDIWPVGRAVISKFDFKATCSNFMHVISTNYRANNLYLNYLLATIYMHGINRQYFAQTTGIQNLNIKEYLSQQAYFPPIEEQEAIAAYLDDLTGKVDALIAEKQKQVEDLRSYRTSLITETVTRGLNPNAPLRPSGIDWLGDISEHWDTVKTAWLFDNIGSGTTPTSGADEYYKDGNVNWLQTGDLNDGIITETSKKVTEYAVQSKGLKLYGKGSLVIAMYGATIAKLGLLNIGTTVNQACCVLGISKKIISKYAFYFFYAAKGQLINLASGGGQPNISQATIYNFKVVVPPIAEQKAIVEFLDEKTEKIDALISELEKQLEELAEYKKAVISEAVTGKVDVRDWKPQI